MIGTSYNGTPAIERRHDRGRGPGGDRHRSRRSPTGTTTTARTGPCALREASRAKISTSSTTTSTRGRTRTICQPIIADSRQPGSRHRRPSPFWAERDYWPTSTTSRLRRSSRTANNDRNVMTKNAAQFYEALKAHGVPHQLYLHQGGHGAHRRRDAQPLVHALPLGVKTMSSRRRRVDRARGHSRGGGGGTPRPTRSGPTRAGESISTLSGWRPGGGGAHVPRGRRGAGDPDRRRLDHRASLLNAATSPNRLAFVTAPLTTPFGSAARRA